MSYLDDVSIAHYFRFHCYHPNIQCDTAAHKIRQDERTRNFPVDFSRVLRRYRCKYCHRSGGFPPSHHRRKHLFLPLFFSHGIHADLSRSCALADILPQISQIYTEADALANILSQISRNTQKLRPCGWFSHRFHRFTQKQTPMIGLAHKESLPQISRIYTEG